MKKIFPLVVVLMGIMLAAPGSAFAGCGDVCAKKIVSDSYGERAPARLVHGIVNLGLSPVELVAKPVQAAKDDQIKFEVGLAKGIINTVQYAVLGVWDIATFWVPGNAGKDIAVKECVMMDLNGSCCKK